MYINVYMHTYKYIHTYIYIMLYIHVHINILACKNRITLSAGCSQS